MRSNDKQSREEQLSGLDRLTKSAAVSLSRRGLLKRLPIIGAAIGLGLAIRAEPAEAASSEHFYEYRTAYGICGSCGPHKRFYYNQKQSSSQKQRGSWTTYATGCLPC
jgi:hypothetical protein